METSMRGIEELVCFLTRFKRIELVRRYKGNSAVKIGDTSGEHTLRALMLAALVGMLEEETPFDLSRVLLMVLFHDVAEITTGDQALTSRRLPPEAKHARERRALAHLVRRLPAKLQHNILALFDEFLAGKTFEAKLAGAADKLETFQYVIESGTGIIQRRHRKLSTKFVQTFTKTPLTEKLYAAMLAKMEQRLEHYRKELRKR